MQTKGYQYRKFEKKGGNFYIKLKNKNIKQLKLID